MPTNLDIRIRVLKEDTIRDLRKVQDEMKKILVFNKQAGISFANTKNLPVYQKLGQQQKQFQTNLFNYTKHQILSGFKDFGFNRALRKHRFEDYKTYRGYAYKRDAYAVLDEGLRKEKILKTDTGKFARYISGWQRKNLPKAEQWSKATIWEKARQFAISRMDDVEKQVAEEKQFEADHIKALKENKRLDDIKNKLNAKKINFWHKLQLNMEKQQIMGTKLNAKFNAMKKKTMGAWDFFARKYLGYYALMRFAQKAIRFGLNEAKENLGHQRTIYMGGTGGAVYGQQMGGFQASGIDKNAYMNFNRGLQQQIAAIKLGQGNAAPLLALGVNALDNIDEVKKQVFAGLKRLDAGTALFYGSQMGMSYEMIESIRSGRYRESDIYKYDEEAIKNWAKIEDTLNRFLTRLEVLLVNTVGRPQSTIEKLGGFVSGISGAFSNPLGFATIPIKLLINTGKEVSAEIESSNANAIMQVGN